jgi:hypothetical protein
MVQSVAQHLLTIGFVLGHTGPHYCRCRVVWPRLVNIEFTSGNPAGGGTPARAFLPGAAPASLNSREEKRVQQKWGLCCTRDTICLRVPLLQKRELLIRSGANSRSINSALPGRSVQSVGAE